MPTSRFLSLTVSLFASSALGSQCPAQHAHHGERLPCVGWYGWNVPFKDSKKMCLERGCCWDSNPLVLLGKCFYPMPQTEEVQTVHVVQGAHFDAGFASGMTALTVADAVNVWLNSHFPRAREVAQALEARGGSEQLRYTVQSWLVALFLDCPSDLGLDCPSPEAIEDFKDSVRRGWITWHAFPHNAEVEVFDQSLLSFGFNLTHELDDRLQVPRKRAMSQRDVPGLTRAALPILAKHNVDMISVGVNGGSTPANLPEVFEWRDPSGHSTRVIYQRGGYSGMPSWPRKLLGEPDVVQVPGLSHAISVEWGGDNGGPPSVDDVVKKWAQIQRKFPKARILASTFDSFAEELAKAPQGAVPVITREIGDEWIYGVASDPVKFAQTRALQRARAAYLQNDSPIYDEALRAMSILALKNGEHTWGLDPKTAMMPAGATSYRDNWILHSNWSNAEFDIARRTIPQYATLEDSWRRQRHWGLEMALSRLAPEHPISIDANKAFAAIAAPAPQPNTTSGWIRAAVGDAFDVGGFRVAFNDHGALTQFERVSESKSQPWASPAHPLAEVLYVTYDDRDYKRFERQYAFLGPIGLATIPQNVDLDDQTKQGIGHYGAKHREVSGTLRSLWHRPASSALPAALLAEVGLPAEVHHDAGAPFAIWLQLEEDDSGALSLDVISVEKTATRLPEAAFLRFRPLGQLEWSMFKLEQRLDPLDVQIGGSQHLHAVSDSGIEARQQDGLRLAMRPLDAGLVCFGQPTVFPTPTDRLPDVAQDGASFVLWNNVWGTNYVQWFPFDAKDSTFRQRWTISEDSDGSMPASTFV